MELDLFSVIPNSPSLLGAAVARVGENFMLSGGFEHFPSTVHTSSPVVVHNQQQHSPLASFSASIENVTLPAASGIKSNQSSLKKLPLSQQKPSTYLQVRVMHVPTATWSPNIIVSNGLLNRAYHASAAIRDEVFLFGGVSKAGGASGSGTNLEPCRDVIRIRKGTFGYKSNILPLEEHQHVVKSAATMGLSANTCGQEQDCVVLFGGYQMPTTGSSGVYSNNIYLFRAIEEKSEIGQVADGSISPRSNLQRQAKKIQYVMKQVEVDTNSATPPPRAFHSATLITPNSNNQNQAYLVVFGGETEGKNLLNDMWILDLTEVLNAEYKVPEPVAPVVETKPAKGGKASKNEPVVPVKTNVASWTKVSFSPTSSSVVVLPRCKHNAFHVRNPNVFYHPHGHPHEGEQQHQELSSSDQKQYDFVILGGLSTQGPLPVAEYNTFSLIFDCTTNKLTATLTGGNHNSHNHNAGEDDSHEQLQDPHAASKEYLKSFHLAVNMKNLTPPLLKALLTATQTHHQNIYGSTIGMVYDQDFNSQREEQLMDEHERISVGLLVFGGCKAMTGSTLSDQKQVASKRNSKHQHQHDNTSPDGFLASFDTTFLITTASKDPARAAFDEPISIYKRIRRIVLKAHEHIEGMRVPNDQEANKLNYLKKKTIRYPNGDVYFGEVIKFKPRTEPEVDEENNNSPRLGHSGSQMSPRLGDSAMMSMSLAENSVQESKSRGPGTVVTIGPITTVETVSRPRTRESWHDGRHKGPYHHMDVDDVNSVGTLDVDNPEGIPGYHVPHGQGKMNYANGDVYEGSWHEGERHGQGTLTIFDEQNPKLSAIYEGEFVYDQRTGKGTLISYSPFSAGSGGSSSSKTASRATTKNNGNTNTNTNDNWIKSTYVGSFLNGLYHGYGELTLEDDSNTLIYHRIFKGQFVHHRKHGSGNIITIHHKLELHESSKLPKDQESTVEGEWKDDKMIGFGKASNFLIQSLNISMGYIPGEKQSSFQMVEHHFSSNMMKMSHIREEKLWLFGVYTGTLVPSLDHTISLLSPVALIPYAENAYCHYEDGSIYEGGWKTGRRNGYGTYQFPNGNKYEGKWIGDKRCGFGRLFELLPADVSRMLHHDDVPIDGERGAGTHSIISNVDDHGRQYVTLYEGQWQENIQHGEGILYNREQQIYYQGQFAYGLKQGNGRYHDLETNKVLEETIFAHDHIAPFSKILGRTTTI